MCSSAFSAVAFSRKGWIAFVKMPAVDLCPFFAAIYFAPIRSSSAATNWRM